MSILPFDLDPQDATPAPMGLIVLQTDETLEPEFRHYFADDPAPMYVNRIPSGAEVTTDTLSAMEAALPAAARLLPDARPYSVVGYGCTSGSAVIGSDTVADLVKRGCDTAQVTNPLRAAMAMAAHRGVARLALISPYIEEVNDPLRRAFAAGGLSTDVFGTFSQAEEAAVARISADSVIQAAIRLGHDPAAEAVFLSCTNLRTLRVIPEIEAELGKPVFSSNSALAWHMRRLQRGA